MPVMLNSIATVSVAGTLDEKLRAIAEAGFKAVEIFENDLIASDLSPEDVRSLMRDLDLACTVYQPFRDFEGLTGKARLRAFDRAERKFDLMQRLGTDLLLVCSSVSPDADGDHGRIAADFHELGERAGARGLRVAYEALAWGRHVSDHRDAAAIVRAADHHAVGLVLDSFHSLARNVPIRSLHSIDVEKLFLVQLADAPRLDMDVLQWSRHYRCMPLQGDLPIVEYVAALQAIGYEGPLSLEIFNDRFRAGSTSEVATDGLRSLILVQDHALRQRAMKPALPDAVRCDGVEFIEFAASLEEAAPLGEMLVAMGFVSSGTHRDKAITQFRQGDIAIVVNCERDGFAGSYDTLHGASVCAIGLRVADAAAVLARAAALSIPIFIENSVLNARSVPALRGIGGSLVYLIETGTSAALWSEEFPGAPRTSPPDRSDGLVSIDHLAAIVGDGNLLSAVLYWTALFDMSKSAQVDLLDPGGVVESRAMHADDRRLRLTLNGSGGRQTLAARFMRNFLGSGFQHIAFTTNDIFALAERLRAEGLPLLPIPDNYYDDVAARHGLDESEARRLRESGILYDADAAGNPFYQLYSRAFQKRFFFEFVQRGDYDGYGAANTQVRLTAQARFRDRPWTD